LGSSRLRFILGGHFMSLKLLENLFEYQPTLQSRSFVCVNSKIQTAFLFLTVTAITVLGQQWLNIFGEIYLWRFFPGSCRRLCSSESQLHKRPEAQTAGQQPKESDPAKHKTLSKYN